MNIHHITLGYDKILEQLSGLTVTAAARQKALELQPSLNELTLRRQLSDTAQAKEMLEVFGTPPLPAMEQIEEFTIRADAGELLSAAQLEAIGSFLISTGRTIQYLKKGCERQISLAFYRENLADCAQLHSEILR